MSTYTRRCAGLMIAWPLIGFGSLVHAQQPFAPRPATPPMQQRPSVRPAPRDPRQLLPQERQFLELEVDLGQSSPFPTKAPVAVMRPTAIATPREDAPQAPEQEPTPVDPASVPIELAPVQWRRDFESTKRRPIETAVFGKGPHRIAVLSSLSGNSDTTVSLVEQLAGVLAREELMPVQLSVLVVRTPNPDGQAGRTLTNSRGVDLNRNFPSTRFTASPRRETGEKPGSESETRAVMQILNQFNPALVVHVVESRSTRGTVRSDDFLPRELLTAYDAAPFDRVYKSGSLAGYVHESMKRSIVEVELPTAHSASDDEDALFQLMVTTLDQTVRGLRSQLASRRAVAQQVSSTIRETGQVRPDGLRGNVELLPPPPDSAPAPVRQRFLELPPPPE